MIWAPLRCSAAAAGADSAFPAGRRGAQLPKTATRTWWEPTYQVVPVRGSDAVVPLACLSQATDTFENERIFTSGMCMRCIIRVWEEPIW